eukprot:gnl/Trimastix_PCT/3739.p1 GENE.gnl/Trimastix_PCT/3739~~gnl/Trimastix_PCT/3739.p1  ORF type:complete len:575 (+),score=75.17 gnl/Trimastix_PCT/3739:76-1800(+)
MKPISKPAYLYRSARVWFVLLSLLAILNVIFQSTAYNYFFYDLFPRSTTLSLTVIFQVFQVASFILFLIAVVTFKPEEFLSTTWKGVWPKMSLCFVVIFAVFCIVEGNVLFAIPHRFVYPHVAFPPCALASGILILACLGLILILRARQRKYGSYQFRTWVSRLLLISFATCNGLFWICLGFIYHPESFVLLGFHYGFGTGQMILEWAAEVLFLIIVCVHCGQLIYRTRKLALPLPEDAKESTQIPVFTESHIFAYLWCLLIFALSLLLSLITPVIHCTAARSLWSSDACFQSAVLGGWSFLVGIPLTVLSVRLLLHYRPKQIQARQFSIEGDQETSLMDGAVPSPPPPPPNFTQNVTVQPAGGRETLPISSRPRVPESYKPKKTSVGCKCCQGFGCACAAIVVPVLLLVACILSMPFLIVGPASNQPRVLVDKIDMDASLQRCEQLLNASKGGFSASLPLWVLRDQLTTLPQAQKLAQLFTTYTNRIDNFFDWWHYSWAMIDVYRLSNASYRPHLQSAYDQALIMARTKGGGMGASIANSTTNLWLGDAHALGRMMAHTSIIAPGNRLYRQAL